mmetsp:Transcript_14574/g.33750  ORF Transcript_14574/g.33750 Transcript_14574/m.33750 type:complete len:90 (-) Transcript_14574:7-276(-)
MATAGNATAAAMPPTPPAPCHVPLAATDALASPSPPSPPPRQYNTKKWLETKYKSKVLFQEERAISSVDPGLYADRFLAFVMGIIQPGD